MQTGKTRKIPIVLVGTGFWAGLLEWFRDRLVKEGMIDAADMGLMQVIGKPEEVVEATFSHYEKRGFTPTLSEREIQLNL